MSIVISTVIFIASFAAAFILSSKLLIWVNTKYSLFTPIHKYIKNSGKQKIITSTISMFAFFVFIYIANTYNLSDWLYGVVLGLCSSIILALLEPGKGNR